MNKVFLIIVLSVFRMQLFAQDNFQFPKNSYASADNPHYWKNRKQLTEKGYWQQDVYYNIKAKVDEKTDVITGSEILEYSNNSPDTLNFVYFRLSQNAFQPESYLDKLSKQNHEKVYYGKYEKQKLGTSIDKIKITSNPEFAEKEVLTILDNTILKVFLHQPLLPGKSVRFEIDFKTYFDAAGTGRRRMKIFNAWGNKHFDGVHWYPRISVYDRKFGWTTDQHLGKEFYGDFGTFDVELEFASNFVAEATGKLLNQDQVLPKELREKLDIKNFKDKPWDSAPSIIIPYNENERKTWKYHAENVHDFAFTADPTYRIGEAKYKDVQIVALAQEGHCSGWQNAADYTSKIIEVYSKDFGEYVYNKMVVADARDGMEYPMLTLDGGRDPDYRQLLAHEVGHNWFFGMVGNNETYRAMLDEGFTQFLTAWSLLKIDGRYAVENPEPNFYKRKFKVKPDVKNQRCFNAYLGSAIKNEQVFINTHSDGFNGALGHGGGYRQVYYKTATMLWNLQYVMGEELFLNSMKNYFQHWHIAHPYIEDMRDAFIQYSKVDLNWFFDQWIETNKTIDYSVEKVKLIEHKENKYSYKVTFKRKGRMQMPLDFSVETSSGKILNYHIPNQWFQKKTNAVVLPKWTGWDILNPKYSAEITLDEKLNKVSIDTSNTLADINRLNNSTKCPIRFSFDHRLKNPTDFNKYHVYLRPDLWYNAVDGAKIGIHSEGNYADLLHKFSITAWVNSQAFTQSDYTKQLFGEKSKLFSYNFSYETPIDLPKTLIVSFNSRNLDGLELYKVGLEKEFPGRNFSIYANVKSFIRKGLAGVSYLSGKSFWTPDIWNNSVNMGLAFSKKENRVSSLLNIHFRTAIYPSSYSYIQLSYLNKLNFRWCEIRSRFFARAGFGSTPSESMLYLGGANPEEMSENKFTRSGGFVPYNWMALSSQPSNFQFGGGMNLRGYVGYLSPANLYSDKGQVYLFQSNSGSSINLEWSFAKVTRFKKLKLSQFMTFDPYLFADAGLVNYSNKKSNYIFGRADAGAGIAFTLFKWWVLDKTEPLTIRFDSPIYLSNAPFVQENNFKFRWLIGIEKSF